MIPEVEVPGADAYGERVRISGQTEPRQGDALSSATGTLGLARSGPVGTVPHR
jgi:hypothetical protein